MVRTIPGQLISTNLILGRYPGSPRQRDQPGTLPASVQDTKGDHEQVWWTVQGGEDSVRLVLGLQPGFSGPNRDGGEATGQCGGSGQESC
jgi:hypothetical protein